MKQTEVLYDQSDAKAHPVYEVRGTPIRVMAYGLYGDDVVQIETVVGPAPRGTPGVDYRWVPLARSGALITLTERHNHFLELVPGYYRVNVDGVDPARLPDLRIVAIHDEASNDSKGLLLIESAQLACQREVKMP